MRQYRLASAPPGWPDQLEFRLHIPEGDVGVGDVFEKDLSPEDELENINSGLLEIVPKKYKVIGESRVHDTAPGEEFEAALLLGNEQALVEGGNIEVVEEPVPVPKPKPARRKKKEGVK